MYVPKYFKPQEFERATPACKISDMSEILLRRLDEARRICGMPFIITSAYRSKEYERKKGRTGTSSHCKGVAVDLHCGSAHVRYRMLYSLVVAGFKRIGIYENFIHADLDEDKVSAVWLDDSFICRG